MDGREGDSYAGQCHSGCPVSVRPATLAVGGCQAGSDHEASPLPSPPYVEGDDQQEGAAGDHERGGIDIRERVDAGPPGGASAGTFFGLIRTSMFMTSENPDRSFWLKRAIWTAGS